VDAWHGWRIMNEASRINEKGHAQRNEWDVDAHSAMHILLLIATTYRCSCHDELDHDYVRDATLNIGVAPTAKANLGANCWPPGLPDGFVAVGNRGPAYSKPPGR
jgi:hypothetical protein